MKQLLSEKYYTHVLCYEKQSGTNNTKQNILGIITIVSINVFIIIVKILRLFIKMKT